jgi:hypothetical protein
MSAGIRRDDELYMPVSTLHDAELYVSVCIHHDNELRVRNAV